jgi:hypothetical protein
MGTVESTLADIGSMTFEQYLFYSKGASAQVPGDAPQGLPA